MGKKCCNVVLPLDLLNKINKYIWCYFFVCCCAVATTMRRMRPVAWWAWGTRNATPRSRVPTAASPCASPPSTSPSIRPRQNVHSSSFHPAPRTSCSVSTTQKIINVWLKPLSIDGTYISITHFKCSTNILTNILLVRILTIICILIFVY